MGKATTVTLRVFRIIIGMLLLGYSLWLLGSFFVPQIQVYVNTFLERYQQARFVLPDIFSNPAFEYLGLFLGSLYFLASLNILTLKYSSKIGAAYLLFAVLVFIIFIGLLELKKGLSVGFSNPDFKAGLENVFILVCLAMPAVIALPFLGSDEFEG